MEKQIIDNLKIIENRFIIDLNDKLGTGSFGTVYRGRFSLF